MKKVFSILLAGMLMAGFAVSVHAATPETAVPLWDNISTMTNVITFDDTAGSVLANISGKSGTTKITATLTVYKQTDDGWEYVDHATSVMNFSYMVFGIDFTGESGAYYKAVLDVTVTCNGTDESETKTAYKTCP